MALATSRHPPVNVMVNADEKQERTVQIRHAFGNPTRRENRQAGTGYSGGSQQAPAQLGYRLV